MNYRWWGSTWGLILWVAWVVAASAIENLCLKDFGFRNEDWDWQYTTYTAQLMQLQLLSNKVHLQLIDVMCFNWMWSKQYFNRDICQKVFYVLKKISCSFFVFFGFPYKPKQCSSVVVLWKENKYLDELILHRYLLSIRALEYS